ncbi:DUF1351 domain-containing protein [Ligilactobacillus sp. LYQ139]|uniref:DUF1351 domain-containing protein n=1 Tax=Ligilactobacillus sp. LYQ139 TaxID=3378800 RepID=UPI0038535294
MNELTAQPKVTYTPAKIELNNHEKIAELVKQAVEKYDGLVVTPETLSECKASRAELNKLIKALNQKRIDIHKEYEKPYNEFKKQIDGWTNELSVVVAQLKDGISVEEEKEQEERKAVVEQLIAEMSVNYHVPAENIEIAKSWLNKGMFTKTMKPAKKLLEAVKGAFDVALHKKDAIETVRRYAHNMHVDAEPYVRPMLAPEWNGIASDVMALIDEDCEKREALAEADREQVEAQKEQLVKTSNGELVNQETGEHVQEIQQVTFTLEGTKEAIDKVAQAIIESGAQVTYKTSRKTILKGAE